MKITGACCMFYVLGLDYDFYEIKLSVIYKPKVLNEFLISLLILLKVLSVRSTVSDCMAVVSEVNFVNQSLDNYLLYKVDTLLYSRILKWNCT